MPSVLVIGIDPEAVPGLDWQAVRAGLEAELRRFAEHGIDASMSLVTLDDTFESTIVAALATRPWDVVVVGGGIRKPEPLLPLFEKVINLIRRNAPETAICFNTSGGDSVEAAERWLRG